MNVNFLGMIVGFRSKYSVSEFFEFLSQSEAAPKYSFQERERFFHFVNLDQNFYAGVMITIKDHKKLCQLESSKGKAIISIHDAGENGWMDFNYFIVRKDSCKILYQHYHGSCGASAFACFLRDRVADFLRAKHGAEWGRGEEGLNKIIAKESGSFSYQIMVKKENIDEIIRKLSVISSIEFTALDVDDPVYAPCDKSLIKSISRKITFKRQGKHLAISDSCSSIAEGIKTLFRTKQVPKGEVVGYDFDGIQQKIKIHESPDHFYQVPFDETVDLIKDKEIDDLFDNALIRSLIDCISDKKIFFDNHDD